MIENKINKPYIYPQKTTARIFKNIRETLIKSFAQIVQSDFLSVCSKNRSNTDVLREFFGHTGGKYASKMCKVIYSVFPYTFNE